MIESMILKKTPAQEIAGKMIANVHKVKKDKSGDLDGYIVSRAVFPIFGKTENLKYLDECCATYREVFYEVLYFMSVDSVSNSNQLPEMIDKEVDALIMILKSVASGAATVFDSFLTYLEEDYVYSFETCPKYHVQVQFGYDEEIIDGKLRGAFITLVTLLEKDPVKEGFWPISYN